MPPSWPALPISSLPLWTVLHDVALFGTAVAPSPIHPDGHGLIAQRALAYSQDGADLLLRLAPNVMLSRQTVENYAKADVMFDQLLRAVDKRSTRMDILLFLLVQACRARASTMSSTVSEHLPLATPWSEYIRFLPAHSDVPTAWPKAELALLAGTSLAKPLDAKLLALESEFAHLQQATRGLRYWDALLWGYPEPVAQHEWVLLDAWFRSRSLQVPGVGTCMVPVLDMVNHADRPNAYYERDASGDGIVLLLRPGCHVAQGDEITISYREDGPAAEMLYAYGFVVVDSPAASSTITLPVGPDADDPLAKPKLAAFGEPPLLKLSLGSAGLVWTCPFVHLSVLNQEDGLTFLLARTNDGADDELRVFWQDADVTDRAADFESLAAGHALATVFRTRCVFRIGQVVADQLEKLTSAPGAGIDSSSRHHGLMAESLASQEAALLAKASELLAAQYRELLEDSSVKVYMQTLRQDEDEFA